jgi:peptidoglycan/xylan/chitin deacetylase (PgdA/CDA1 family)
MMTGSNRVLPILMYHHVSSSPGLVTISPHTFRRQMEWLVQSGWKTLNTRELEDFFSGKEQPRKSVVVTFDDGYLDTWVHVQPVMEKLGLNGLFFITTGWIGDGPARFDRQECHNHETCKQLISSGEKDRVLLRWSEIEAMTLSGTFEFHNHTHTHRRWDKELPPGRAREAFAEDISQAQEILRRRLGRKSRHLCWPQGYYNPEYIAIGKNMGLDFFYTTERRLNHQRDDTSRLGRISTKEREGVEWLKWRLRLYVTPPFSDLYMRVWGD